MPQESTRTPKQSDSLHLWFKRVSEALNASGLSMQLVLAQQMDIPFTKDNFKNAVWRPAQRAYLGKESTRDLRKIQDIDKVIDILRVHFAEKFKVELPPFPSLETLDEN